MNCPFEKVSRGEYNEYEFSIELPERDDGCASSIVLVFSEGPAQDKFGYCVVLHEVDGDHSTLRHKSLPKEYIRETLGIKDLPVDVMRTLAAVNGNVFIHDGIAVLPDGSTLDLGDI